MRTLGCADLFRVMAFSQLTWRESLRDIEACLAANQTKLFHMGIRSPPARSTLADALNGRDWRIYHALAQRMIARARVLYAQEPSVLELDASVYALDSTTIALCLSLFDWAPFRTTKAAIKLHTLLDLRGAIPAFIYISDGKLHDVNVLDILPMEAGALLAAEGLVKLRIAATELLVAIPGIAFKHDQVGRRGLERPAPALRRVFCRSR